MNKNMDYDTMLFHLQLLSNLIDVDQYPFVKLIIEKQLNKDELVELFQLLQMLEDKYVSQKEEGFLDFSSFLIHFAGMLNEKLDPNETIYALNCEGYFPNLIKEFMRLLNRGLEVSN